MADRPKSELPPPVDRRIQARKRVILGAVAVGGVGNTSFKCRIKDLTQNSARIVVPERQVVPTSIYLINIRDRTAHGAVVIWTRGLESGLQLVSTIDLATTADPSDEFLKKIWTAHSPRSGDSGD